MKTLLTTLTLLFATLSFAQESSVAIESMEGNVLFRGYANKIRINSHPEEGCYYALSGSNVSVSRSSDHYIVKPGRGKTAYLTVTEKRKDGSTVLLRKKEFQIANLPDPSLHWGWTPAGKAVKDQKPELTCKYVGYYPLDASFEVKSWSAEFDGKTYSGEGSDITALNELIQTFTELTEFGITAEVQGPDGITRKLGGTWFIRPTTEEK